MNRYGVLHIDLGHTFRGGQRETYNLCRYLKQNRIDTGCVVANGGELEKRLISMGVSVYPVEYGGFDIVRESIRLRKVCKELGYQIVHAHDSHGHNLALTMKFINAGLRILVTRQTVKGASKPVVSNWKYTNPLIDLYIAVSSAVESELLEWGVSSRKVARIPVGVDQNWFVHSDTGDFRQKYRIPEAEYYIGTACALDSNKDVATLVNAIGKLSYLRDDFTLLVAGEGDGREELERLIRFIELEDKVILLGQIDEMPQFYSLLNIFVLSSRSEALPFSLIEAGACGCALVSSDCGGTGDLIDDGRTGYLFPVEDDERLFRIVNELLEDRGKRESMAKSFAATLDQYEMDHVCRQVMTHYTRLAMLTG